MILCDFYSQHCEIIDGGHFEFAQPTRLLSEIFELVFNYKNLDLCKIWDLYPSGEHPRDLPTALRKLVILL